MRIISSDSNEGIKKILLNPIFANKTILKNMLPIKMSTVILTYAKPLIDKRDMANKKVAERTIRTAVEVWNSIIVVDKACGKSGDMSSPLVRKGLLGVARKKLTNNVSLNDYFVLVEQKDKLYPDNNYFIIEHSIRWSDDGSEMSLTVVTNDVDKVDVN